MSQDVAQGSWAPIPALSPQLCGGHGPSQTLLALGYFPLCLLKTLTCRLQAVLSLWVPQSSH